MSSKELTTSNNTQLLQMAKIPDIKKWYNEFVKLSKEVLKEDLDFGKVPGVDKPALFKPGAEKLRFVYGLQTKTEKTDYDIDLEQDYIDYTYKTTVLSPDGARVLAECEGNCNSLETKFRYVWVKEDEVPGGLELGKLKSRTSTISEFDFAINKAETTGQYGKPQAYWDKWNEAIKNGTARKIKRRTSKGTDMDAWEMGGKSYRIQNPDIMGHKNTIMKMAQKRSFVGAILMATGASEFFTQDVEEMEIPVDDTTEVLQAKEANTTSAVDKPQPVKRTRKAPTVKPEEAKDPIMEVAPIEGEVVQDTVQGDDPNERARIAKLKWVEALARDGKIEKKDYASMPLSELSVVMDNYRKGIGK